MTGVFARSQLWGDKDTREESHVRTGDQKNASVGQRMSKVASKPRCQEEAWKISAIGFRRSPNALILDL